MKTQPLTTEEDRIRRTVTSITRYRGLKGVELARLSGIHTMGISSRLNGKTAISIPDLFKLADALDVDPCVLLMEPDDALRWVLDRQGVDVNSIWISPMMSDAA